MLRITSAPATEPVTVQEVKDILRLTSTADDLLIAQSITAAREIAEKITRRSLVYKGYIVYFDCFPSPGKPMRIPSPPLVSVESILYMDALWNQQTLDPSEYLVAPFQEPGLIMPQLNVVYPVTASGFNGAVEVHFHAGYYSDGYGDATRPIPEHLRLAIRELAGHLYDHPEVTSMDVQNAVPLNLLAKLNANKIYVF